MHANARQQGSREHERNAVQREECRQRENGEEERGDSPPEDT